MFNWVKKLIKKDKPQDVAVETPVVEELPVAPVVEEILPDVAIDDVPPELVSEEMPALPPVPVPTEDKMSAQPIEVIPEPEPEPIIEDIILKPSEAEALIEEIITAPQVEEDILQHSEAIIEEAVAEEIPEKIEDTFISHPALHVQDPEESMDSADKPQNDQALTQVQTEATPQTKTWFKRLKDGLAKSSSKLTNDIKSVLTKRKLDQEALDEIEEILILADVGVSTASKYVAKLKSERFDKEVSDEEVRTFLATEMAATLKPYARPLMLTDAAPHVILMVGVNGTGKTTTIGKLAQKLRAEGHSVMMAAGDTFRAAAIEQLKVWADRTGAIFMGQTQGGDAAALAFDALQRAKKEGVEVLLIDTAGRLHNKKELMEELSKIIRVLKKQDEAVPHDTVLVLDATTGQNAYAQVKTFQEMTKVSGLIVTKLDGTAKGGVVVGLADQFNLPIHAVGVGETVDDLHDFDAEDFAKDLMGLN